MDILKLAPGHALFGDNVLCVVHDRHRFAVLFGRNRLDVVGEVTRQGI